MTQVQVPKRYSRSIARLATTLRSPFAVNGQGTAISQIRSASSAWAQSSTPTLDLWPLRPNQQRSLWRKPCNCRKDCRNWPSCALPCARERLPPPCASHTARWLETALRTMWLVRRKGRAKLQCQRRPIETRAFASGAQLVEPAGEGAGQFFRCSTARE